MTGSAHALPVVLGVGIQFIVLPADRIFVYIGNVPVVILGIANYMVIKRFLPYGETYPF